MLAPARTTRFYRITGRHLLPVAVIRTRIAQVFGPSAATNG
jgi:hypothetical protein